jgi:hypothetical protein
MYRNGQIHAEGRGNPERGVDGNGVRVFKDKQGVGNSCFQNGSHRTQCHGVEWKSRIALKHD